MEAGTDKNTKEKRGKKTEENRTRGGTENGKHAE